MKAYISFNFTSEGELSEVDASSKLSDLEEDFDYYIEVEYPNKKSCKKIKLAGKVTIK